MKSKQLFPYITDLIIVLLILTVIILAFFIAKSILYTEKITDRRITVITETLPKELDGVIKTGDAIYDNLTKKRLGEIDYLLPFYDGCGIAYKISFISKFEPRGDSLRTKSVWFKFSEVTE